MNRTLKAALSPFISLGIFIGVLFFALWPFIVLVPILFMTTAVLIFYGGMKETYAMVAALVLILPIFGIVMDRISPLD